MIRRRATARPIRGGDVEVGPLRRHLGRRARRRRPGRWPATRRRHSAAMGGPQRSSHAGTAHADGRSDIGVAAGIGITVLGAAVLASLWCGLRRLLDIRNNADGLSSKRRAVTFTGNGGASGQPACRQFGSSTTLNHRRGLARDFHLRKHVKIGDHVTPAGQPALRQCPRQPIRLGTSDPGDPGRLWPRSVTEDIAVARPGQAERR